jgi:two-component system nitrogen regulation response regulator NtrX
MAILSTGDVLDADAAPIEIQLANGSPPPSSLREARDAAEREEVLKALEQTSWNVSQAARILGLERTNLHKRIRALGLKRAIEPAG